MTKLDYFLILFFVSLGVRGYAQSSPEASTHSFGIKGGLNYATIGGDASGVDPRIGFHAGLFSYTNSGKIDFGAELQFSSQGTQEASGGNAKVKYNYITMGLITKLYPFTKNFNVQIGPQFGYMVSAKEDEQNLIDQVIRPDLAIVAGMGYKILSNLECIGRYNYSLTSTSSGSFSNKDDNFPNRVIQLGVAFSF